MSEKLEEILAKMAEKSKQQQTQIMQQQMQITNLLTAIQGMPGLNDPIRVTVQPAAQDVAAVRADMVQRLAIGLRKRIGLRISNTPKTLIYGRILRDLTKK